MKPADAKLVAVEFATLGANFIVGQVQAAS